MGFARLGFVNNFWMLEWDLVLYYIDYISRLNFFLFQIVKESEIFFESDSKELGRWNENRAGELKKLNPSQLVELRN